MKAVNLIPADGRRGGGGGLAVPMGPTYPLLGLLALALVFVTIYVLTTNTISERKAKIATLQAEVAQEQAVADRLTNYAAFEKLAQARAETVRQIAATRFDWHGALSDLSKVVPANTSLQSLVGSVAPGVSVTGAGGGAVGAGGGASALRSSVPTPAFELTGCTSTQDDVARLMSRLRLINGVTRVTLGDSQKQDTAQTGASVGSASGAGAASTAARGCRANTPTFDLVIFFAPLPVVGASGATSATAQSVSNAAAGSSR